MASLVKFGKKIVYEASRTVSEYRPPLTVSRFKETGELTPEEFVLAGDFLVNTCPTWSWESGDPKTAKPYLPKDKQYLVTRGVPCLERASAVQQYGNIDESLVETDQDNEGWLATATAPGEPKTNGDGFEEIPSAEEELAGGIGPGSSPNQGGDDEDEIPDLADLELQEKAPKTQAEQTNAEINPLSAAEPSSGVVRTRTYDLMISYDKHHAVPRFWLVGYDEDRLPLNEAQVREDVCQEHYNQTVTVEAFPHSTTHLPVVSVHPCKHAPVMHKLSAIVAGEGREFDVEHYMVLFLKFISSVVPTIEYDYTMPAGGL